MVEPLQVHSLVRLDPLVAARWPEAKTWVADSLRRAPWAVVRRERAHSEVPIGVRGTRRSERFAASIACADICESISPFHYRRGAVHDDRLAGAFDRLSEFALLWRLRIGPIGSYGFELASGVRTTHATSDLDVLVHATQVPLRALRALAAQIDAVASASGVRIDAELQYSTGGAALSEVVAGPERVLFKTDTGPKLLPCPV